MQGVAGNSGTDSNNPGVQLTYDDESGRFIWEGDLIYTETGNNRQFNFITSREIGIRWSFWCLKNGDSDSYRELVEDEGVYKMKKVQGPGNPLAASWGIAPENNGRYRIEADVAGMDTLCVPDRVNV